MHKKILKIGLILVALIGVLFFMAGNLNAASNAPGETSSLTATTEKLPVYFFYSDSCQHCHAEIAFLNKILPDYPGIELKSYEVSNNRDNANLFIQMFKNKTGQSPRSVPVTFIGDEIVSGFSDEATTGAQIKTLLDVYLIKGVTEENNQQQFDDGRQITAEQLINYPLIGKINLVALSLPIMTAVLGTIDGFNPCSMWALIVLVTLLINTGSRRKLWIVGVSFILVSALSYYLFLTAWLNTFLFIGYLMIVRIIVAIMAVGVGGYFLIDFWKKRKQNDWTCEVTSEDGKTKIINRLQKVLLQEKLLAIIVGVAVVAVSVNMIEFICSAGIPTIFTQILSQSNLSKAGYYLYLLWYDFFYMLDDIVVLIVAGVTWRLFAGSNKFVKYAHLLGGILLMALGLVMLINPNLLTIK